MEHPPEDMDYFPTICQTQSMRFDTNTKAKPQKGEGFPGQRLVVLPRPVLVRAATHPILNGLLPTDVGFFPAAGGHWRVRKAGVEQAIFIFCAKGRGWCEIGQVRHRVGPSELLVIPSGTPHAYGAEVGQPWSIHWFHAQGSLLGDFLRELGVGPEKPVFAIGESSRLLALFEEVLGTIEHGYTTQQLIGASQALAHLLAVLIREHCSPGNQAATPARRIAETIVYMRLHLRDALKLDALAAMARLSRSRYAELFKQQTGFAPIDYFIRLRMHRACWLLDSTDQSIKSVAAKVGYEDPLYFSRVFRTVHAMSPAGYRRMHKG